jgi:hypothetical protein
VGTTSSKDIDFTEYDWDVCSLHISNRIQQQRDGKRQCDNPKHLFHKLEKMK